MTYLFRLRLIPVLVVSLSGLAMVGCSWFSQGTSTSENPVPEQSTTGEPTVIQPSGEQSPSVEDPAVPEAQADNNPAATASPQPEASPQASAPPPVKLAKKEKEQVSQIVEETSEQGNVARQDAGKTYLDNILLLQQTERFVGGTFVNDLSTLSGDIPEETDEYQFKILKADAEQTVAAAIAKIPGRTSYIGAAYNVEGSTPISAVCKSNLPSQKAPSEPKLVGKTIVCASGSTAME